MTTKRTKAPPVVRDTLPAGATVAFNAETCSAFARLFRHALAAQGFGFPEPAKKKPGNGRRT